MKNLNEPKQGFWGVLARKAKAILDDDNPNQQSESPVISNSNKPMPSTTAGAEVGIEFCFSKEGDSLLCFIIR